MRRPRLGDSRCLQTPRDRPLQRLLLGMMPPLDPAARIGRQITRRKNPDPPCNRESERVASPCLLIDQKTTDQPISLFFQSLLSSLVADDAVGHFRDDFAGDMDDLVGGQSTAAHFPVESFRQNLRHPLRLLDAEIHKRARIAHFFKNQCHLRKTGIEHSLQAPQFDGSSDENGGELGDGEILLGKRLAVLALADVQNPRVDP